MALARVNHAERTLTFVAADDEYRSEVTIAFIAKLDEGAKIARAQMHFPRSESPSPRSDASIQLLGHRRSPARDADDRLGTWRASASGRCRGFDDPHRTALAA